MEDYSSPIKYFEKLLEINEKDVTALNNLALCYNKLKDYENSIKYSEKMLQLNDRNAAALKNIEECKELMK